MPSATRPAALFAAALAVLALAACGGTPGAPTATPTETASPTPTATADAALSAVVLGPDGVELLAGEETLEALAFDGDPDAFVAAVTEAIGDEPTVTEQPGDCCHFGPSTWYEWGGLRISVADEGTPGSQNPPLSVAFTAPTVGEVELRTADGYRVGDDCFAIADQTGASLVWSSDTLCDIGVEFGVMHGEPEVDGYPNANAVELIGDPAVTTIIAPANLGVARA
jgi:hypothetical protein